MSAFGPETAAARGLAACHTCTKLAPVDRGRCPRCGARLHLRFTDSIQRTVALGLTASILYVPANVAIAFAEGGPRITTLLGWIIG